VSCMGTVEVASPGRVSSRKEVAEPCLGGASLLLLGEDFFGVAFFLGVGLVEVDCSTSSTVFVGATSSKEGFSTGVGPAFLLFDAVFDLGGMLTDADGFSASAVFVADFTVEGLAVGVVVELVDRGLSPGLIAGYGAARAPDVRRSALGMMGDGRRVV